ncbi:MAG: acyl-CoA dehydrogenase family protein [Caulobacterales bacterium]
MNLLPDSEQTQLLDAAIDFLRKEAPVRGGEALAAVRARMGRPFWKNIAELGWIGLGLSEDDGGVGYTLAEEALFFREFGRYLVSPAILGAVLGARVAAQAGKAEIAEGIIAGDKIVGVAINLRDARVDEKVSGSYQVIEGEGADFILFCSEDGAALVAASQLGAGRDGVCLDDRVGLTNFALSGAAAAACVTSSDILRRGMILTAAMLAGVAEASRDVAVEYAKTRVQFGQAIGGFQAIKHRLSDMAVRCEAATSLVFHAAIAVRDGLPIAALDAASAKAFAGDAAMENASGSVQVHGGMGVTEQMTPHLYVKRARLLDQLFGDHRSHYVAALAAPAA